VKYVGESSLCNEQFGFRPQHRTVLQLAYLIERVTRNFELKKLTSAFFLDVAKAFDNVWVSGLFYKLIIFNLFLYLVKTISSYLHGKFKASFQTATSTCCCMQAGVAQGRIISSVLSSLYVHMPLSSCHVNLALYMDDTSITTGSRQPVLLVKYQETYLSDLERWLREWRFAINILKSTVMLFAKAGRHIPTNSVFGELIHWVDTARYLGVTLGKWLTWSIHIEQARKNETQRLGVRVPLLNRSGLSIRNGVLLCKQLIHSMMD